MKKIALILAAGQGIRMKKSIPKQFLLLNGIPILMHTIKKFSGFNEVILVLPKEEIEHWKKLCVKYNFDEGNTIISGGKTRFESVKNGLAKIQNNCIVVIHDGVRPIVSKNLIKKIINKINVKSISTGIIPVIPIKDSIRKLVGGKFIQIDRENIYKVQTPQCFISTSIKNAYNQKFDRLFTDDASVLESNGGTIIAITGENNNIKITTKKDLKTAEKLA